MEVQETNLKGCYLIIPKVFEDSRGYFFESFNSKTFEEKTGKAVQFVQDNQSYSTYGIIRGLHAQAGQYGQAKLVRVLAGEVLDVAVDIRPDSPTFGEHVAVRLSAENKHQLFVPRGFLHGFSVLSETATFFYKCDNFYHKAAEQGVMYNDDRLGIDWKIPADKIQVSEKDVLMGSFDQLKQNL